MAWAIQFSRHVLKDAKKLRAANLEANLNRLLALLKQNPYEPPDEKLAGNLQGYYSRQINIKHRLVYAVDGEAKTIRVVSVWSHYE